MKKLIGFGLALAATAPFAHANGGPDGKGNPTPLADAKVTFKPGQGITFDGGDEFMLNLTHRIQAKWRFVNEENASDTNGFRVRRARQAASGHIFSKDITYRFDVEHNESSSTKDVWVKWNVWRDDSANMSIRIGQQKTRGGLEWDGTSGAMMHVERSVAARTFAEQRSRGVMLEGRALDDEMLGFHFGVFNSDPARQSIAAGEENNNNGQNEVNFVAGIRFDPNGSVGDIEWWSQGDLAHNGETKTTAGASVFVGNERDAGNTADIETVTININAGAKLGNGMSGQGDVWIRSDDQDGAGEADSTGWTVQGGYTTPPEDGQTQWGFGVRVSMVDFDDAPIMLSSAPFDGGTASLTAAGDVVEVGGAVTAFYHGHAAKTQFGYTFQSISPDAGTDVDNHMLEIMTSLIF